MKNWLYSKTNFYLFGLCGVLLAIGYILLGHSPADHPFPADNHLSKSVAPVILVVVYCGLIPFAMLYGYGKGDGEKETKK